MRIKKEYKLGLVALGVGLAFLIGVFSPSITGMAVGSSSGDEALNETAMYLKLNNSISKVNETIEELFECKNKLLDYNLSLKEKEDLLNETKSILKNKTRTLEAQKEEIEKLEEDLDKHERLLNISYRIAKEFETQGICESIEKKPESVRNCLKNAVSNESYWNIIKNIKTLSTIS